MSTLIRTLRFVGDLDDDFYRDERQRDVWNEASAVGFQVVSWTTLLVCAVLPWVTGRTGAWITLALLAMWLLGSNVTLLYARAHQVDPGSPVMWRRPRVLLSIALYLIGAVGVAVELLFPDADLATWVGGAVGAACGGAAAALAVRHRQRKREERAERELAAEDL